MIKKISLHTEAREEKNGKANIIREAGYLPAVLYGSDLKENKLLKIKELDFGKAFASAGESSLVDLAIGKEEPIKVIIKDVQKDPIKDNIIHVDFFKVDMKKKIEIEVPLNFINEAPAVKELGGTLVKVMETVDAKCLPGDLIEHFDVDLSVLKTYGDNFKIKHLQVPENIEILESKEETIAHVMETKEEIIEEPVKEEVVEGEGETEEGEKPAEGEGEDASAGSTPKGGQAAQGEKEGGKEAGERKKE